MTRPSYLAAIDIGGTKVTASLASREGILVKLYQPIHLEGNQESIPKQAHNLIKEACQLSQVTPQNISALGISTASPFQKKGSHRVVVAPNLCHGIASPSSLQKNNWKEIPLESYLLDKYPQLKMDNDCIAAVKAESLFGEAQGIHNFVYVTWSTGIGMGCMVDGQILHGKNGNAGHGGHIYLSEEDSSCFCGQSGDLESLVAGPVIARQYDPEATTKDVFQAFCQGEKKAQKIIHRASQFFARGLASINNLLDTELFILGGSVFFKNQNILLPLIEKEFQKSFPVLSEGVQIKGTSLGTYLGDIAAYSLILPPTWIQEWQKSKPWQKAPQAITIN